MAQDEVVFGPFTHSAARGLVKGGQAVKLGSRSLAILNVLLERPGEVVGNRDIMARVWPGLFVEEANIRVHIGTLRKALGKNDIGTDYIENVPAQGYRFVGTVRGAAGDADERPPPAPPQSFPQPLPRNIDRLIGREQAIDDIARKVVEKSFVTVTGVGGIGKTSLAVEVARLSAGGYRDGAFFVDLSTLSEPALLCANIAQALKLPGIGKASMDGFLAAIKGLNALVVLDNCEHLIEDVALLVEGILTTAPDVHLLVTSREILRAQGEWVYRLPPLAAPAEQDRATTAEQAMRYSAVELFVERVSSNDELFRLTDADAPVVAALCRHLDGVPLALELAAARVPLLGIHGLAASLDRVFDVLRGGRRTALQRHQTLRATLEWSYRLLDERERVVLHRLSGIRGSFTRDLAIGVAAFGAVSDDDVVEGIAELAKKSLVSVEHREQTVQFRLLETTRQYAAERLGDSGETDTVRRNLALQLCRMLTDSQSTSTAAWNAVYGGRIDDLRSALEWSLSPSGDLPTAVALTIGSAPMWFQLSLTDEFRLRADKVLNAIRQQPNPDLRSEMAITAHLGPALWNSQGPTREVKDILARGLALSRQLGDVGYQRRALWGLWLYHLALEEDQDALEAAGRFGTLLGDPVDPGAESMHQRMLTLGLLTVGEFDRARAFAEQCLSAPAPTRGSSLRGYQFEQRIVSLTHLARISWIQGKPDQARQAMEEAMEQALASGHALSLCFALSLGACPVAFWLGDYDRAARYADMLVEKTSEGALFVWRTYGLCFQLALEARTVSDAEVASLRRSSRFAEVYRNRRIRMLATVAPRLIAPDILAEANAGPRNWATAELLRLTAEATPDRDEADGLLRQSMDVALEQGATSWSLRTAMSMARRSIADGRPGDAAAVLLPAYERFTEGHDTPDLKAAAALLDSIA
ncbi:ATP-binding protein [Azospirillum rugosum]|uniref:ATPase/DNA-binding winged helix-turn-helix (WHTH) protein n=1 Tax=Azospirillum rugosum TaxID=416170 RepID=A0ABS4SK29_9PROT|nr:winged helix-turn-helix domain-containing protein [Azospirillum rugosum]MBP2292919.1 putative ATPase/DNA-binding winged helix-turn-helix (wHTH) protein [Azospirillum rugosum]MDQ0529329.1 putative ATPase/DNA-binding winged helix-turn-helix (wHTH) protein [Azospirillum rugosum]